MKDDLTTNVKDLGSVSTTKTPTGNMLGRTVVGGVLLGGVGALAGASTSKKETTTSSLGQSIEEKHDYTLYINVDSLSSPIEKVNFGKNINELQETAAILNIIIKRNNQ